MTYVGSRTNTHNGSLYQCDIYRSEDQKTYGAQYVVAVTRSNLSPSPASHLEVHRWSTTRQDRAAVDHYIDTLLTL